MIRPTETPRKKINPEPNYEAYLKQWAELYEGKNYDAGLTGYFLKKSHLWAETRWGPTKHFSKVLEVGAGTGVHIRFIRHGFDTYTMTDLNPPLLDQIEIPKHHEGKVEISSEDATKLSFEDNSFDRVIATHVLEHLPNPHQVLTEWGRVLKPGGTLTLVLPCDPGVAWRLGRYTIARNNFIKAGLQYDYWMAREHINPINNLVSLVRHYFPNVNEQWLPLKIPSIDVNLFYICDITV